MARKIVDCREYPSEKNCSLTISGEEGDVIEAATIHAISFHGEKDTPELRGEIKKLLKDEGDYLKKEARKFAA